MFYRESGNGKFWLLNSLVGILGRYSLRPLFSWCKITSLPSQKFGQK